MSLFRGHSYRSLDPKGRLVLPSEFRSVLDARQAANRVILTKSIDGCVVGYPLPEWEAIEASFMTVNSLDPRMRKMERFLISAATEVEIDKQGRVLIPPHLRTFGGLQKDVVLAGVIRKFEIWDQLRFEENDKLAAESFDEDMANLAASGIELRL